MKTKDLLIYHEEQMDKVKQNRAVLTKQGYVKGYGDVYPDIYERIHSQKGVAYIRGNVSIKLMAILYDVVIVYIPPLSKKQLMARFYLKNWDELITLCQHGIVIPIIGKAENYTAAHFDDLFHRLPIKPYSLWARGLGLLDVFGMSNTLEIAKEIMPVNAIANDEAVFKKWAKRYNNRDEKFIKAKIKDDVAVQYADLCIFGCKNEAKLLLALNPRELYKNLKLLNEVRTYPILFGLESQANFDRSKLAAISTIPIKPQFHMPQALPEDELEILYRGIGIDVDSVSVTDIIAYHNDGLGKKLRSALTYFNDYCDIKIGKTEQIDLTQVYERAEAFQKELKEAINDLNCNNYYLKLDKSQKTITKVLQIGTVAAGAIIATNPDASQILSVASVVVAGFSIIEAVPESIADVLVKFGAQGIHSKFVANMWSAKKIVGGEQ